MAVYEYPAPETYDPQVIIGKLNSVLQSTTVVSSLNCGLVIGINTTRDLTPTEKSAVDTLMSQTDVGTLPDKTGYTIFQMDNLYQKMMELRATIPQIMYVFNVSDGAQIWISGTLSPQDQNRLRGALSQLLREVL